MLGIHKDEALYTDPETYNPDRFLKQQDGTVPKYFFAFGAGPRICLGDQINILSIRVVLSTTIMFAIT